MYGGALRYLTRADIVRAFHYHRRDFPRRFFYAEGNMSSYCLTGC
jgi:hypothetical protein